MTCPHCAATIPEDDIFCEECGKRLIAACSCGSDEIDDDGFCARCGRRARALDPGRQEQTLSEDCAAATDRGLVHARNDDRFGLLQAGSGYALVVCDGVSCSRQPEQASSAVAAYMIEALGRMLANGAVEGPENAIRTCVAEAAQRLADSNGQEEESPSTTLVAALVEDRAATIGWVGDSRAYWISNGEARQLTADHSWINAVVEDGQMTPEEAGRSPRSHGITRWLGADAAGNATPDIAGVRLEGSGWLLLCTDGLWNYAPDGARLAALVDDAGSDSTAAIDVARRLIQYAYDCGGHDNVTAAVLRIR